MLDPPGEKRLGRSVEGVTAGLDGDGFVVDCLRLCDRVFDECFADAVTPTVGRGGLTRIPKGNLSGANTVLRNTP